MTELARRVIAEIQEDDCLGRAAQLAYYFLFALFPFFLFLTTLLGYLPMALSTYCMLAELSGRKGHDHLGRSSYAAVGRLVMSCQLWNRLLIS